MSRDPWKTIWQVATSRGMLLALLSAIGIGLAISVWLPQLSATSSVAYAQQLSEAQARFGHRAAAMGRMGLLNVTRSFTFRALMASLAGCLVLRLVDIVLGLRHPADCGTGGSSQNGNGATPKSSNEPQRKSWRLMQVFALVAHTGGLLVLFGLLLTYLWGWRVENMILQSGKPVFLDDSGRWVALQADGRTIVCGRGLRSVVSTSGPGFWVTVNDEAGHTLEMTETSTSVPTRTLRLALSEDRYFAVPEAGFVFRLSPQAGSGQESENAALVQVYRSPPGRLVLERSVENSTDLTVDHIVLHLVSAPYVETDVLFAPGSWPTLLGLALLAIGIVASVGLFGYGRLGRAAQSSAER